MSSLKLVDSYRRLRFELLEGRLMMSGDPVASVPIGISIGAAVLPIEIGVPIGIAVPPSDPAQIPPHITNLPAPAARTINAPPMQVSPAQGQVPGFSQAVAQQADGKLLVAGVNNGNFEIARYNTDGTLDASFGTDGVVNFGNGNLQVVQQIELLSDGSFLVLGEATVDPPPVTEPPFGGPVPQPEVTTLIHVREDDSVDASYGNAGLLSLNDPALQHSATFQADGKIIVQSGSDGSGWISRFYADGTLDTSFYPSGTELAIDPNFPVVVDRQGRIIVAFQSANGLNLERLNSDGSLDASFGTAGIENIPTAGDSSDAFASALLPDGKILVASTNSMWLTTEMEGFQVVRLNADGTPDTSFGGGAAIATTEIGQNLGSGPYGMFPATSIAGIAVQSDGKIVVTAELLTKTADGQLQSALTTARFNTDGSLDTNYGDGGIVSEQGAMGAEFGSLLQNDGSLVVVGANSANSSGVPMFDIVVVPAYQSQPQQADEAATAPPTGAPTTTPVVTPVIMAPQVVTLNAPTPTIVTNPVSTSVGAASQPAAPTAGIAAASLLLGDTGLSTDSDDSQDELAEPMVAFGLAHTLAN